MFTVYLVIVILLIILLGIRYCNNNWDFWKKRNVKGPEPMRFFGNYGKVIFGKVHLSELTKKFYDEYKEEKMVGIFALNSPVLVLRDLDLIKDVLINDSSVFSDRGIHVFDTVEPLSQHLFNLHYNAWQPLRSRLSAAFSGNKEILGVAQDIANQFVHFVERAASKGNSLDCFAFFGKYMTEVIGEYAFGLKLHQLEDDESEFQKVGEKRQLSNFFNFTRRFLREYYPGLYKCSIIFIRNYNKDMTNYFVNMLREIENHRTIHNVCKKDFVGRLLELKNNADRPVSIEITNKLLAAQAYVLFTAGADTSSVIISNGLYELAVNESIQEKLRGEINNILKTNDQTLFPATLKNMPFLDSVYKEILRKYPLRNIIRKSNATYTFYGTNVTIPKNTKIIIPHYAIHRDSDFYPNPELFDPERFSKQESNNRHPMAYLPFGNGPHYCIGKKWATIFIKVVIIKIIMNFNVKINQDARERKETDPRKVFLWPKGGIHLKFEKRRL